MAQIDITKQAAYVAMLRDGVQVTKQAAYVVMFKSEIAVTKQAAYVVMFPKSEKRRRRMPLIIN